MTCRKEPAARIRMKRPQLPVSRIVPMLAIISALLANFGTCAAEAPGMRSAADMSGLRVHSSSAADMSGLRFHNRGAASDTNAYLSSPAQFVSAGQAGTRVTSAEYKAKPRQRRDIPSWTLLERRFPGVFVISGPRNAMKVALTFDDVPDPRFTGQVLDILAKHKVKATFFVVGWRAVKYPELVRRIHREGHTIGNHSYGHAAFSALSEASFIKEIRTTDTVLSRLTGSEPRLIRPPYGEISSRQLQWARDNGRIVVNWDVDSVDWKGINQYQILKNVRKTLQPGSIILQHAGGGVGQDLSGTIAALPGLIAMLRNEGYELVTVPDLLGLPSVGRPHRT
ncbi:polysaccharide deacetylase family protein [Paenibacillus cisolokensis]|uniref:polysaccharide deacetylase family protein n=1 Tax=Paenibacillus cisolokensis TaxID=1658519 RepID=UPI003D2DBFB4